MNNQIIIKNAEHLYKIALNLDPFRNAEHDIEEAIDYADSSLGIRLKNGQSLMDMPQEWFSIKKIESFPLKEVLNFDDYSSWGDIKPFSLKRSSKQEKALILRRLRGRHAEQWLEYGIPAIILLDICGFRAIGDGRGERNLLSEWDIKMSPWLFLA